jgi:hypothetical protein
MPRAKARSRERDIALDHARAIAETEIRRLDRIHRWADCFAVGVRWFLIAAFVAWVVALIFTWWWGPYPGLIS